MTSPAVTGVKASVMRRSSSSHRVGSAFGHGDHDGGEVADAQEVVAFLDGA
ncbi:hypothetical protein [Corynebacterium glutamicum]|uniref:hypothetical protein n=1 Tax=Corynebacterium glutamicum TaxID=1718 RepID=UPI0021BD2134|nr:hypothetical protein [Corynebacterium glutamicum]